MAKPASAVLWGGAGTRLEPSGPQRLAGFSAGDKPPARWLNWLFGELGDWTSYLDTLNVDPDFVGATFGWTGTHLWANPLQMLGGATMPGTAAITYSTPPSRTISLDLHRAVCPGFPGSLAFDADGCVVIPPAGSVELRVPFRAPVDAVITGVNATVSVGSAGVNITLKLKARGKLGTGAAAAQVGATDTRTGVASQQAMAVTGLTETALATTWYWLEVVSSDTTGSGSIKTATVTFNDPGPQAQVI